jgi:predicted dehydrogenase
MHKTKVAIIGSGPWGRNILRTVSSLAEVIYVGVRNIENPEIVNFVTEVSPKTTITNNLDDIWDNPEISHVFIATPPHTHESLALRSLSSGKHTFVEKPLSTSIRSVTQLHVLAQSKILQLVTGYIYLFDESFQKLQNLTEGGNSLHLELNWEKWGSFETPITTNLLVHELAAASTLLGEYQKIIEQKVESDSLHITLQYQRGVAVIIIKRTVHEKRKWAVLRSDKNIYHLEQGILSTGENGPSGIICACDVTKFLEVECSAFLDNSPKYNWYSIDSEIAKVLSNIHES